MHTTSVVRHYADGSTYEGQATLGSDGRHCPHGEGRWTSATGEHYAGAWKNGQRHGSGELRRQGRRLQGTFTHDEPPRHGTLTYADHRTYRGDLEAGEPHGHGCLTWPQGQQVHTGDYVAGQRQGHGTMRTPALTYRGLWHHDLPNDIRGTFEHANGDVYIGSVVNGLAHGPGEQRMANDGRRLRGVFVDDAWPTIGTLVWPGQHARTWEGALKGGLPAGAGKMAFADRWTLHGSVRGNLLPSHGRMQHPGPPAVLYVGALLEGRPHGDGSCTWPGEKLKAQVTVGPNSNWTHLFQRAQLAAQVAALCDTRGNSLRGRAIYQLPCGHVDSDQHLRAMQKTSAAFQSRNQLRSAQMTLRCGIAACRTSLATVMDVSGPIALPRAKALESFFCQLGAALPVDLETAEPGEVSAFLEGLAAKGLRVPAGNLRPDD